MKFITEEEALDLFDAMIDLTAAKAMDEAAAEKEKAPARK